MATNKYFNLYNYGNEQSLLNSLNREVIQQQGYDFVYLPRRLGNYEDVMNEDDMSFFDTTYTLEMFIKNIDAYGGSGNIASKFGLEINDQMMLSISRIRFKEEITKIEPELVRPREGDLIWFPMTNRMFQIMYVENAELFYPTGTLPLFGITLEMFEYSAELFNTGVPEIDNIVNEFSTNLYDHVQRDAAGDIIIGPDGNPELDAAFEMETVNPSYDNEKLTQKINDFGVTLNNPYGKR